MHVTCLKCSGDGPRYVAGICVLGQGDEYTYDWYLCPACDHWTMVDTCDAFSGDLTKRTRGPYPRAEGDAQVARIRLCPAPDDKFCTCDVHRSW